MGKVQYTGKNKENKKVNESRKELGAFLKEHVISKTKVLSIIGIVLMVLMILLLTISDIKMIDENTTIEKTSLLTTLKERIIILLLILLAGWVPYFYIPAIAYVIYIFMLSGEMLFNMELNGTILTLVINSVPAVLDIFTVAIITAIGIYMCNYTTKKYRYAQRTSFSFLDVKMQLAQITKKQDKYENLMAEKEKKITEMEKNNVKIDYKMILKTVTAVIVVNLLVCIIQYVIN